MSSCRTARRDATTAAERRTPIASRRASRLYAPDDLAVARAAWTGRRHGPYRVRRPVTYRPGNAARWKTNEDGMSRLAARGPCRRTSGKHAAVRPVPRRLSRVSAQQRLDGHGGSAVRPTKGLRRSDEHQGRRALHADVHRSRRPRARPDLRRRARRRTSPSSGAGGGSPSTRLASRLPSRASGSWRAQLSRGTCLPTRLRATRRSSR